MKGLAAARAERVGERGSFNMAVDAVNPLSGGISGMMTR